MISIVQSEVATGSDALGGEESSPHAANHVSAGRNI